VHSGSYINNDDFRFVLNRNSCVVKNRWLTELQNGTIHFFMKTAIS